MAIKAHIQYKYNNNVYMFIGAIYIVYYNHWFYKLILIYLVFTFIHVLYLTNS